MVLLNNIEREVQVDISAAEGTAVDGSDFVAASATLSFSPDDKITPQCKTIEITDDLILENSEYFMLKFSTSDERVILPPPEDVVIHDDERKCISLSAT